MVRESLQPLSPLHVTSCGSEGKSPETLRSRAEKVKLFGRAVEHPGIPDWVCSGPPTSTIPWPRGEQWSIRNYTMETAARDVCLLLLAPVHGFLRYGEVGSGTRFVQVPAIASQRTRQREDALPGSPIPLKFPYLASYQ